MLILESIKKEYSHLLPKDEDILFYKKHGWYTSPVMLDDMVIKEALDGTQEFYRGEIDKEVLHQRIASSVDNQEGTLFNDEFVTLQKESLANAGFHPLVVATAAILAETDEIRLFADSLLTKKPSSDRSINTVGWHSDKAYWPTCTSNNMLTAWIPLQDCTLDMGPLFHIDESHRWRTDDQVKKYFNFTNMDLSGFQEYLQSDRPEAKEVPMLLKKGQVSFHNCHTIHASRSNLSSRDRIALAIHFQDATNKYQQVFKPNGDLIRIGYDYLCREDAAGNPDYRDPSIFPTLLKSNK
ncbi:MAG: phytanoyl-CoA dioxygenase family protein [Cytophagales bacterium]|nr:phytanoyl-CoA dioxygenase family protein [Cytophagales bacterium]